MDTWNGWLQKRLNDPKIKVKMTIKTFNDIAGKQLKYWTNSSLRNIRSVTARQNESKLSPLLLCLMHINNVNLACVY